MTPDRLKHLLASAGVSQQELGRRIGVNPRTVRRWVEGVSGVADAIAADIEAALSARPAPRRVEGAAQALRLWRERANMTQGQAAAALGLSRQAYCALEREGGPAKRLHLLAAAALEAGLEPVLSP